MNLQIHSSRPPSARCQSRINPITGEEMPFSAREVAPAREVTRQAPTAREVTRHHTQPTQGENKRVSTQPTLQAQGKHCVKNRPTSTQSRPNNVPQLVLGKLTDDDDLDLTLHMDPYSYSLDSPGTASTVSWGTPGSSAAQRKLQDLQHYSNLSERLCSDRQNGGKTSSRGANNVPIPVLQLQDSQRSARRHAHKQPTVWDKDPVPENLPPPPQQYKQQYNDLKQEMKDSYRAHTDRTISNSEVERKIEELRLEIPAYVAPEDDDDKDTLKKDWTQQPYSKAAQLRRQDKESLEEINRKKKLIETVMIDQLSRPVISRPEGGLTSSRPRSHRPGVPRGTIRTLHDSKVTVGTATENLLSRRVQFGARVLTRNGRDAVREMTGFYFAVDKSITVYEFRQLGKSGKALPFIQRGTYSHLGGSRKGKTYCINDIKQGECLSFECEGQPVPDSMKVKDKVVLKVTYVDDDAKAGILFEGVALGDQDDVWKRAHIPQAPDDVDYKLLLLQVQECSRKQIEKRGIKVFTGLCSFYHKLDEYSDGKLNKVELDKSLIDFHIEVPQENFEDLWDAVDTDASGFMEFDVFLRAFLGEMSEHRKALVLKAFRKIDSTKQGEVTFDEIKKFYNAHKHPRVRSGECRESEVLENFLYHFSHTRVKGVISYYEFECYYEGLSVCVGNDEDFNKILQNAWSI